MPLSGLSRAPSVGEAPRGTRGREIGLGRGRLADASRRRVMVASLSGSVTRVSGSVTGVQSRQAVNPAHPEPNTRTAPAHAL